MLVNGQVQPKERYQRGKALLQKQNLGALEQ